MAKKAGAHSTKSDHRISRASCASAARRGRTSPKRMLSASTTCIAAGSFDSFRARSSVPLLCFQRGLPVLLRQRLDETVDSVIANHAGERIAGRYGEAHRRGPDVV